MLGTVVVDELSTTCAGSEFCTEVTDEKTVALLPEDVAETLGFPGFCLGSVFCIYLFSNNFSYSF